MAGYFKPKIHRRGPYGMNLIDIVTNAWKVGNTIDLSGVGYGQIHWGNHKDIIREPFDYYKFLSGFVAVQNLSSILEIGTHWGGATVSMARGCAANNRRSDVRIFTIDMTDESDKWLLLQPESRLIQKYVGDANKKPAIDAAIEFFKPDCNLELLFIDADHSFMPTFMQYAVYRTIFSPKYVILDDINLNDEMRELWKLLTNNMSPSAYVVANEIVPDVRGEDSGLGIISIQNND